MRRPPWFLSLPLFALLASPAQAGNQAQPPRFTIRDAIQAEWARQPLTWTEAQKAALPPADRARLERTHQRIGTPGTPPLLPAELEKPTLEIWEAKAAAARTPQERFTALFMLNRLKSPRALLALDGLAPTDAAAWPKHLHLEASLATARLNGGEISPALQAFLDARQKAGKVDPVRAQAARLRLVLAGKEKELLPTVPATPGSVLALMDAWNRTPKPPEVGWFGQLGEGLFLSPRMLKAAPLLDERLGLSGSRRFGPQILHRLMEGGIPDGDSEAAEFVDGWASMDSPAVPMDRGILRLIRAAAFAAIARSKQVLRSSASEVKALNELRDPSVQAAGLAALRATAPEEADQLRSRMVESSNSILRAAAIEDLPSAPADLERLSKRTWSDTQFEAQQTLIQSYARWKMNPEDQKAQLRPWLQHPDWACRWEAYQALVKLDPAAPWPAAPKPTKTDEAILKEAVRLAERGKPVRLRITFGGKRQVTLRLDPTVAPMNVANLVLLARKGYFNGRLVPRVVPDFVVQMGSPYDTMDGGPGYTVRCEDSLDWYGPGSVGMALSGKDTGGSQFFITTNATPHLTGRYTRLGEVEDLDRAMKILDDLELGAKILSIKVLNP
ncbi:MAG TPA: peptidylprolyl isomerase [Geothrix sp.]|nr:peptidylprolyl isomerase [Geothrix sp.]